MIDNQTVNNTQTNSNTLSDDKSSATDTNSDGDTTDTDSDEETTDTSSDEAIDADGNIYNSVIIGTQEWMAENLKTSKYNDGTAIPNITDKYEWGYLKTDSWCHYDNDSQYDSIYGKLYNWYAVETGKLCPTGWHVPTDAEWTVLTDYLGANEHNGTEGKALKSTSGWDDTYEGFTENGTDDYGWNGLPGGHRYDDGDFKVIGKAGQWWTSSSFSKETAWPRILSSDVNFFRNNDYKKKGFSVRCLRD
jgi:uncharacterized protein (TIGR02145 family)